MQQRFCQNDIVFSKFVHKDKYCLFFAGDAIYTHSKQNHRFKNISYYLTITLSTNIRKLSFEYSLLV